MPIVGPDILKYEKRDRIVIITLNRPERMNAISIELAEELAKAWKEFKEDNNAWVAILTGAGEKGFCAGFDLIDQAERDKKGIGLPEKLPLFSPNDHEIWKPVIGAINGDAIAGGFLLAQHCDVRIAAEHAEFGIAETRWNLPAYWVHDLTKVVNLGHALEIAIWGDKRHSAQRFYEIGFVNKVVPKEKLMEEAISWAERILYLAPRCVRNIKEILNRGFYMPPSEGMAFAKALEQNLYGMEDTLEGPKAFKEGRKPIFKGK